MASEALPSVPRTPGQGQVAIKRFFQTPNTDRTVASAKTPRRNLFGKSPSIASASHVESGREEADLTSGILGILENERVALKASTKLRIQSLVEEFQAGLEGKLAASNANLERVLKHLDEMEMENQAQENQVGVAGPSS